MLRIMMILALCLSPALGTAQPLPEPISPYVNDLAGLLDANDMTEVRGMLAALKYDTGIQMTVLTLDSQAPYGPNQSLESFATDLFNDWGIGDAKRNDGILILVLPDDRAMRIELGAGYDQTWNDEAGRVIDRSFLPSFRSDKYARGIKDGVSDTIATLARPFAKGQPAPKSSNDTWLIILAFLAVIGVAFRRWIGDFGAKLRRCPTCGRRGGLHISRQVNIRPSPTANGSSQKTTRCKNCDYHDRFVYPVSYSSSSGKNGFGGGRSGGGGASGRW
jgi:uncharacterized protein